VVTAEIDPATVTHVRSTLPFLADRRNVVATN
jgi:hypothetical protein